MLKATVAAGALAIATFAAALTSSPAMAAAPNCLHQVNPYVACTNSFKAMAPRQNAVINPRMLSPLRRR